MRKFIAALALISLIAIPSLTQTANAAPVSPAGARPTTHQPNNRPSLPIIASKCAAHSITALIHLALGWSTLLQQGASGQRWLAIDWVVNRKLRTTY
jgi:hypothetical protein